MSASVNSGATSFVHGACVDVEARAEEPGRRARPDHARADDGDALDR
jgi:hypothetical protein